MARPSASIGTLTSSPMKSRIFASSSGAPDQHHVAKFQCYVGPARDDLPPLAHPRDVHLAEPVRVKLVQPLAVQVWVADLELGLLQGGPLGQLGRQPLFLSGLDIPPQQARQELVSRVTPTMLSGCAMP